MKYLVANFKNKLNKDDIVNYNNKLGEVVVRKTQLVVAPSMPFLAFFGKEGYSLATQDISSFVDKTITGEVTGEQLKSMGVSFALVGHSERRKYKHEINIDFINKINNALLNNIGVIYCIGETLEEKEQGNTYMVLEKQIREVLNNIEIKNIIIAYEPVWAIGTSCTPTLEEIEETVTFIKTIIFDNYGVKLKVLYGGSVNDTNISDLNKIKCLDGFLVGGASLSIDKLKFMLLEMED